jgi:putative transposase
MMAIIAYLRLEIIDAWVILPGHLHCVWTLPPGDDDFANRWRLIKQGFSKALPIT